MKHVVRIAVLTPVIACAYITAVACALIAAWIEQQRQWAELVDHAIPLEDDAT